MRLAIIGSGYVGLVSGACLAELGHEVVCVDRDAARVAGLLSGRAPFYEPGLEDLLHRNIGSRRLSFTTDLAAAVVGASAVFIAVGTPTRGSDGQADLSQVHAAAREIAKAATAFTVVVTKSTVPVGTGDALSRVMSSEAPQADLAVASNPEFLREGHAIGDFMRPDRVVLGADDERAFGVLSEIYLPLSSAGVPVLTVARRTAELTKYAANAFLATKITFINEMADLCERVGADVRDVALGIGMDQRIGPRFLQAGPGYGGSCFPKDTLALVHTASEHGVPLRVVEGVVAANKARQAAMARKVALACGGSVAGRTVGVLGLTFKPDTDDMREAPSIPLIQALREQGAAIRVHDPVGMENARPLLGDVHYAADAYACAETVDVLVLVTEWDEYRTLDLARLCEAASGDAIVDLRNAINPIAAARAGFRHFGIGIGATGP